MQAETRTEYLPNWSLERHPYTDLFGSLYLQFLETLLHFLKEIINTAQ
jgi:hypothetical protein